MTSWQPSTRSAPASAWPKPKLGTAMLRGAANRCPVCGEGRLFAGYLAIRPACDRCGVPLGHIRADDAPPYFTIFLVGHIVVPLMLLVEREQEPALWIMAAIFLPLTLVLCLLFLRPVKGATLGLMLSFGMNGREQGPDVPERPGAAAPLADAARRDGPG
ncbi:MAG: DUF983 domain-containing protein [Acetobacteraceae bacterium]|nr:DUF983 domain-containing protein [Acetobacteraceae bacterium]